MRKSVTLDEYTQHYGLGSTQPLAGSKAAEWHDIIETFVDHGLNISDTYRELVELGYDGHRTAVGTYIKVYFPHVATYRRNQYTNSNRCKNGHEWTEYYLQFNRDTGRPFRRCKICDKVRRNSCGSSTG